MPNMFRIETNNQEIVFMQAEIMEVVELKGSSNVSNSCRCDPDDCDCDNYCGNYCGDHFTCPCETEGCDRGP